MISQHLCSKNFNFFLKMQGMWAGPILALELCIPGFLDFFIYGFWGICVKYLFITQLSPLTACMQYAQTSCKRLSGHTNLVRQFPLRLTVHCECMFSCLISPKTHIHLRSRIFGWVSSMTQFLWVNHADSSMRANTEFVHQLYVRLTLFNNGMPVCMVTLLTTQWSWKVAALPLKLSIEYLMRWLGPCPMNS